MKNILKKLLSRLNTKRCEKLSGRDKLLCVAEKFKNNEIDISLIKNKYIPTISDNICDYLSNLEILLTSDLYHYLPKNLRIKIEPHVLIDQWLICDGYIHDDINLKLAMFIEAYLQLLDIKTHLMSVESDYVIDYNRNILQIYITNMRDIIDTLLSIVAKA